MTADEHAKVDALCRKLFPHRVPDPTVDKRTIRHKAEKAEWAETLWDTYNALIEVGLI